MSEGPENHILSSIGPLLAAMLAFSASLAAPIHDPISHDEELFSDTLDFYSGLSSNSSGHSFVPAGSNEVAIVGEPAHLGDLLTASILVHNQGNSSGEVSMNLFSENWSSNLSGEAVNISPGSSRDVSATFSLNTTGQIEIQWAIVSPSDSVSDDLSGTIVVESLHPQALGLIVESESWTLSDGLQIGISVLLSDGHSRNVEIIADLNNMGVSKASQVHSAVLSPGIRDMSFDFGNPDADSISFSILPVGWMPSEHISVVHQLTPPTISTSVSSCSTTPDIAIPGDSLVIECVIANSGISEMVPGTESNYPLIVPVWPDEGDAIVELVWISGDSSAMQSIQIQTRDPPAEGFKLPFDTSAALLGSVIGLVAVMVVLAVWRVISEKTPSTEEGSFKLRRESRIERRAEVQKMEVICPSCEQRLSVPKSHVGAVKCPSCTNQFQVGVSDLASEELEEETRGCPVDRSK